MLCIAAILGALAVLLGAFAAHALTDLGEKERGWFDTGARYHLTHALALGLCATSGPPLRARLVAAWCFGAGILLFSGSLYAMAVTGVRGLAMLTPIGGVLLVVGWVALAVAAKRPATPA